MNKFSKGMDRHFNGIGQDLLDSLDPPRTALLHGLVFFFE